MSRSAWWKRLTPAHFALRNRCRWAKNHEIRLHVTRLEERRVLDAAVLVADLNPGAADGSPSQFTQYNGSLYFSAAGQDSGGADVGRELFRLDSNGHVSLAADIRPGSAGSDPGEFTAYRGSLYFAATGPDGRELYRLDAGGHVSQVADIAAGHASSNPAGFTEFDGKLHFAATGSRGRELYEVDDANRVHLVSDIRHGPWSSDPREFTEYAGKLYFAATGWEGRELFALNRGGQVHQVGDIFPWWGSSNPEELIVCNGSLYFAATSFFGGRTLYRCDSSGHCAPSSAFGDGVRIANPEGLTEYDGNLVFQASLYGWGGSHGDSELYVLDVRDQLSKVLTTDGASLTEASGFTRFNGSLVFAADTIGGRGLFRLQSGGECFQAVAIGLPPGVTLSAGEPTEFAALPVVDGDLYFRAMGPTGTELYRVNGSDEVTLAADVNVGSAGSYPREFVVFENRLYFSAETTATGRELYCLLPDPSLVVIAGSDLVFTDIAGEDNAVVVFSDGCNLHIRDDNGHTIFASLPYVTGSGTNEVVIPLANLTYVRRIVVNTKSGTDSLSLDLSDNADSVLAHFDSMVYDGGSNDPSARGDVLRLIGDGRIDAVVTPDGHVTGSGQATVSGAAGHMTVDFRDVEPVDVTGMFLAKLTVPITATLCDALAISDGKDALTDTRAALVVSGTVGGLPIESVHLFANREVAVETGSGAAAACDRVLIASAWGWHENGNLAVVTGQTCDQSQSVVSIEGDVALYGDLHVRSGRIVVDASITVGGAAELIAGQSILFTERGTLLAQGSGGVLLDADDCGDGTIAMADGSWINAGCGPIELRAGGDVFLGRLATANSTASAVRITSIHGGVFDAGDRYGPDIEANSRGAVVTITTRSAVGAFGNPLETRVHSLLVRTDNSDVFIVEQDQLEVVAVDAGTGFVYLAAGCSIVDSNDGQRVDIVAGQAVLMAKAIGEPDNPLETRLGRLEAVAACGGLWLVNLGDLTVGGITEDLNGLRASKVIDVRIHGNLDAEEAIVSECASVGLTATGDIVFHAPITACGGSVRILAEGDLLADPRGRLSSAGDVLLIADSDGSGSGTIQFAGNIFVGGGFATFQLSGQDGFFSGSLSGPGGLVKQGSGSLRLTATSQNSYLGATFIEAGTLIVDGTIGLCVPAGIVTIGAAGTLSGSGTVNGPIFANSLTAQIVSTGNLKLGDGSAAGFDFAGAFVIGGGHVVEVRDADGAQLGFVTSIGHGSVLVARGGVEVSSGELLTGFGRVQGDVTILAGGEIAPGPGAGILTTGQLTLRAGAVLTLEIFGPAAGSQVDQLGVTGAALGGARLSLAGLPVGLAGGTVLVLIDNVGPRPVQGYFVDSQGRPIPEGGTVAGNGFTAVLSYAGGRGGNDVTLTVVDRLPIYVVPPSPEQDGDSDRGLSIFALGEDADRAGSRRSGAAMLFEPETVRPPDVEHLVDGDRRELEQTDRSRPRVYFRVFDDALGVEVGQDHELEYSDLADPLAVFRRHEFPNGHYKVYVQEPGSRRVRLVLDVHIYDGRIVPADYREEVAEPRPNPAGPQLSPPGAAPPDAGDASLEGADMTPAGFAVEGDVPVGLLDAVTRQSAPETFRESGDPWLERPPAGPAAALVGMAGLTTCCQLRVRVRQAVNSTNGDFFRASQLLGRVRRRGSVERAERPRVDAVR